MSAGASPINAVLSASTVRRAATGPARQPLLLGATGAAAAAYTAVLDPGHSHAFPLCPLKLVTGIDCPVCGSLRAAHSLLHGHVGAAAGHNLLFVLAIPFVLLAWATWMTSALGWPIRRWRVPSAAWWPLAGLAAGFMLIRNLPGDPMHWLAST